MSAKELGTRRQKARNTMVSRVFRVFWFLVYPYMSAKVSFKDKNLSF